MPGEQDPSQQDVSRFEAFKSTLSSAAESIKGKTAVALIGVVGLTGAAAIESQASTEPASAANVPEATASDLQQDCVDAALDDPLSIHTHMSFPGAKHGQTVAVWMRFKPTSAACKPLVSRDTPVSFVKMQNPKNHKKLIKSQKKELVRGSEPFDANAGLLGEVDFGSGVYDKDGSKIRYRCTDGNGVTRMWVTTILRASSATDGSKLGQRSITKPVKIPHKPRRLLRDHELPGPC